MRKIVLYIAASLDQRIAEPNDGLEWLISFPNPEKTDYGYEAFLASVDTIIMGGRTYRELLNMDTVWPYPEQQTYVISRHHEDAKENIRFITDNVIATISAFRNEPGKDIWLEGGGEIIAMMLEAGLVDEMRIFYIPVILGKGIPLFPEQSGRSYWKLADSKVHDNGVLEVAYQRK